VEQRKRDDEARESKRQQQRLNFLLTQTELYTHFMGKESPAGGEEAEEEPGLAAVAPNPDYTALGEDAEAHDKVGLQPAHPSESSQSASPSQPGLHCAGGGCGGTRQGGLTTRTPI
jgi:DNA helicase INO80